MGHWQLLERIFTVETLMTPYDDLLKWDRAEPIDRVWEDADKLKIDTIPVHSKKDGRIDAVLQRGMDEPVPLTYDWLITRDTSVPGLIKVLEERKKQCLLVLAGQEVVGIVTPADLNKLAARTYFYNVLAELEMTLATHIRRRFPTDEEMFEVLQPSKKRKSEILDKMTESKYEIDAVHAMNLSDMVNLIRKDEILMSALGFASNTQVRKKLNGLVHFRNDIMHPGNVLLTNEKGIDVLSERCSRLESALYDIEAATSAELLQ